MYNTKTSPFYHDKQQGVMYIDEEPLERLPLQDLNYIGTFFYDMDITGLSKDQLISEIRRHKYSMYGPNRKPHQRWLEYEELSKSPCSLGKYRSRKTNRCVSYQPLDWGKEDIYQQHRLAARAHGKEIVQRARSSDRKRKMKRSKSQKRRRKSGSRKRSPCKRGWYRHPVTKRCRKKGVRRRRSKSR